MTPLFWTAAAALVALAWSLLWAGQRRGGPRPAAGRSNVALLDAELARLDAELDARRLDPARHRVAVGELQRRLLVESAPALPTTVAEATPRRLLAGLALALPVFVGGAYLALGNPAALNAPPPVSATTDEVSPDEMRQMVDALSRQLQSRPAGRAEDLPGWIMLARSQAALRRFGEAASAYERAVALSPDDAQLLADLADVLTVLQAPGSGAAGADRVGPLLDRALALDPRNLKALALAGNAASERREVTTAIDFWRRARAVAPAGSDLANGLDQNLADAGAGAGAGAGAAAPTGAGAPDPGLAAATGRSVVASVSIAPGLAGRLGGGDTVFVFARAENGPRMPLAIVRRPVAELARPFTLDDSTAMSPALRLSKFGAVVVGARISRSGNAMPQSGDLVGEARAEPGSGRLSIVIDRVQP